MQSFPNTPTTQFSPTLSSFIDKLRESLNHMSTIGYSKTDCDALDIFLRTINSIVMSNPCKYIRMETQLY